MKVRITQEICLLLFLSWGTTQKCTSVKKSVSKNVVLDQCLQHYIGTCQKYKFLGLILDLRNQKFRGLSPALQIIKLSVSGPAYNKKRTCHSYPNKRKKLNELKIIRSFCIHQKFEVTEQITSSRDRHKGTENQSRSAAEISAATSNEIRKHKL